MLLLIDNRTSDIPFILSCLESHVTPVIFDFWSETFDSLAEKIPEQRYIRLGILQENYNPDIYCMLDSFGESILKEVEILDPNLETWTSFHLFIELCVSRLEITSLDLLDYYDPKHWVYISNVWNLPIYSSKLKEKMNICEQWTESPLIGLYFKKETLICQPLLQISCDPIRVPKQVPVQRTIMHKLLNNFKSNNLQNK
jgi:hypothetical protein